MLTIDSLDFLVDAGDRLRSLTEKAVNNIDRLPKDGKYALAFSGGKDSHALLAIYSLYLQMGGKPLDLIVTFADTHLEALDLYVAIDKAREYCASIDVPFVSVEGKESFWWYLFGLGYPVPGAKNRWCTVKLKIDPQEKLKRTAIRGRHFGESIDRDRRLKKGCGSSECGTDMIENGYDPILDFSNCDIFDLLFFGDGKIIYKGAWTLLQSLYSRAEDEKTGSLRMGCAFCPVVTTNTIAANQKNGIIPPFAVEIRKILEQMRSARRINSYRSPNGKGAIHISDRREYWQEITAYLPQLLEHGWITPTDIDRVGDALARGQYPPTYPREWIDSEHDRLERERKRSETNPFSDLPLFRDF